MSHLKKQIAEARAKGNMPLLHRLEREEEWEARLTRQHPNWSPAMTRRIAHAMLSHELGHARK